MKKFLTNKKNLFLTILFLVVVFLLCKNSFISLMHNSFTIRRLTKKSAYLDVQYKDLTKEYQDILGGKTNYIEDNARIKYNMATPGEIEFRIKRKL